MQPTLQILTAFEQIKVDGINCISLDENQREVVYIGWNTYLHVFIKYIAPLYNLWYQSFVKSSSLMINIGFLFRINNTTIIVNRGHKNKNEMKQTNKQIIALLQPLKYDKLYEILLKLLLNLNNNNNFDEQSILSLIHRFVSDEIEDEEEEKQLNPDALPFVPSDSSLPHCFKHRAKKKLDTIQEHAMAIYDNSNILTHNNNNNNLINIETNTLQSLFPILLNAQDVYELSLIPIVISRKTKYMTSMAFDSNSLGTLSAMVMTSNNRNRFRFNDNNLIIPTTKMITSSQEECKESKTNHDINIVKNNKKTQRNKKNNNRKKKQRMKKRNMKLAQNKSDYFPSQVNETIGDIIKTISKKMTTIIIPSNTGIKKDWYTYMRKLTVMHFNDNPNSINDEIFAINYGIYDKKSQYEYYLIIESGKMIDKLFTKKDVMDIKRKNDKLKIYDCPANKFKQQLNWDIDSIITYLQDGNNTKLFESMVCINWCNIDKFIKKNNKQRIIYQITNDEFRKKINYEMKNLKICKQDLLPIIMFRTDKHWLEWVWKFRIEQDIIIGISLIYDDENDGGKEQVLKVTGIHLDIERLLEQHDLIKMDNCNWESLNDWNLYKNINDIQISGNLDDNKNRLKSHCKNQVTMWEYVINAINSGESVDISKLETYKKNAQKMLQQL